MPSTAHPFDDDLLESMLAGKLTLTVAAELEQHLEVCADCRNRLDQLAAKPEEWQEAREQLTDSELMEGTPSRSGVERERRTGAALTITEYLAPTDDPHMMGRLGAYEIAGIVGAGGMGVVLKGWDRALNRFVAIKVLAPQLAANATARKRFAREAQAAAAVVHDNIVAIHGVSEANGLPYLVMPYIRGQSLQKRLDQGGPLSLVEALRVGHQIASGLAAAHAQGLVHRDIKPANILLEDGVERLRITDFGLARAVDDSTLTTEGTLAGTPEYMSPEQARGEIVGQQSDLFSLGSVLYAACTGRSPFRSDTSHGALRKITDEHPRLIRAVNVEMPEWFEGIILKLLEKSPGNRFESAQDTADLMLGCLAHVQHPTQIPLPVGASDLIRKSNRPAPAIRRLRNGLLAATFVIAATALVCLTFFQSPGDSDSPKSDGGLVTGEKTAVDAAPSATTVTSRALTLDTEPITIPSPSGYVRSLAFARDNATLVVAINDAPQAAKSTKGTIQIWNALEKKLLTAFPVHSSIFSVDVSTDQRVIAIGTGRGSVEVLDATTGKSRLRSQIGDGDTAVRFSPGGEWLAAGTQSGKLAAWNAKTLEQTAVEFEGESDPVLCLAFSADDQTLAAGGGRFSPERPAGNARVWEFETGKRLASMKHTAPVMDVTFLKEKAERLEIATACLDGFARNWNVATGETIQSYRDKSSGLIAVRYLPGERKLATLGPQSGVKLWNLQSESPFGTMRVGESNVTAMAVSPDGKLIATGGHDRAFTLWNVEDQENLATLSTGTDGWLPPSAVTALAVSSDGQRFVIGREDGGIMVREVESGRVLCAIPGAKDASESHRGHLGAVTVVSFLPSGDQVLSGGADWTCRLWDVATGRFQQVQLAHSESVRDLAVAPDGQSYFSASSDHSVAEWEIEKGVERSRWEAHDSPVTCVRVIDESRLLTTSSNGSARIWKLDNHDLLLTCDLHETAITAAAVSPDGSTIATGTDKGHVLLWSARTGWDRRALKKQSSAIHRLAFSPDGKSLISGGSDGVLRVWDLQTLEERQAITAHRNGVTGVAFLGNEPLGLMTTGSDGSVKRWSIAKSDNVGGD